MEMLGTLTLTQYTESPRRLVYQLQIFILRENSAVFHAVKSFSGQSLIVFNRILINK